MLVELRVRDLAVIADARLELAAGLNVLTGETGAGKSLLVDALSLLLGERAESDLVRRGQFARRRRGAFEIRTGARTTDPERRSIGSASSPRMDGSSSSAKCRPRAAAAPG